MDGSERKLAAGRWRRVPSVRLLVFRNKNVYTTRQCLADSANRTSTRDKQTLGGPFNPACLYCSED